MLTAIKPRMSDDAVESRTGKTWGSWFKILDAAGALKMTHREIAAHLSDQHKVGPWWTQMVAVNREPYVARIASDWLDWIVWFFGVMVGH